MVSSEEGEKRLQIFGPNKLEEKREQIPQVFGVHVEPPLMGHGICCYHGYCLGQWRGTLFSLFLLPFLSLSNTNTYTQDSDIVTHHFLNLRYKQNMTSMHVVQKKTVIIFHCT